MYKAPTDLLQILDKKNEEIAAIRKEMIALAKGDGPIEIENYTFKDKDGKEISISDLFGAHDELILIHNMGKSCPYCTLWADGLSSVTPHINNRCAFVLTSPNEWSVMRDFTADREWKFPYYSTHDTSFTADMGFAFTNEKGNQSYWPGFTTFLKKEGKIYRVACDTFGPGDVYAPVWHMLDMLHHSDTEWHPKFSYE